MRVRTLLLACIGLVGCLAVASATLRALDALADQRVVARADDAAGNLHILLRLNEQVAVERSVVTTLFTQPDVLRAEGFTRLDAVQARSDAAWDAAAAVSPGVPVLFSAQKALNYARQEARALLEHPRGPELDATTLRFVAAVNAMQAAANTAADMKEREVGLLHAELGRLAGIARLSQSVRETSGLRSNMLSLAYVGVNRTEELFRTIDEMGGRVAVLWDRTVLAIGQVPESTRLAMARDQTAATLMGTGEATYRSTNEALRDGLPLPLALPAFRAWTVPMLGNALLVRDAAVADARDLSDALRAGAAQRLRLAITAAAAALCTALGAALVVLRRVATPLSELTSAMMRLARGDLAAAVPGLGRRDELGAMARAVEVFKTSETKISWMARHDTLTRLPNRPHLRARLGAALDGGGPVTLLLLDLDGFKAVNDTLGHAAGDVLLQQAATRLQALVRDGDLVARLGGDEFAVLLCGPHRAEDACALAQRLVHALAQPFDLGSHQAAVSVSIGTAMAVRPVDADTLTRNADQALYQAKADGRGTHRLHDPAMDQALRRRRTLETDLRHAVASEALALHYQPIVNIQSGRIVALEALVRWTHPIHGPVSPAEFIPIAEHTGLIRALGTWVLRDACRTAACWPAGVRLAVNLSPVQFGGGDLVATVSDALAEAGFPAWNLDLEITEQVLLRRDDATLEQLQRLRALGARVCLDDFGIGYSSLSYLHSFPFDKIKIDQSFVRDLPQRDSARAIVRAIAGLGAVLGMATTAEGVETPAQAEAVRAYGCTEVQGFLFSPPRPASDLPALLARTFPTSRTAKVEAAWASP